MQKMDFEALLLQISELEKINRDQQARYQQERRMHEDTKAELQKAHQLNHEKSNGEKDAITRISTLEAEKQDMKKTIDHLKCQLNDTNQDVNVIRTELENEKTEYRRKRKNFLDTMRNNADQIRKISKHCSESCGWEGIHVHFPLPPERIIEDKIDTSDDKGEATNDGGREGEMIGLKNEISSLTSSCEVLERAYNELESASQEVQETMLFYEGIIGDCPKCSGVVDEHHNSRGEKEEKTQKEIENTSIETKIERLTPQMDSAVAQKEE